MKLENGGPQEWCNITVETQSEVGDNVGILAKSSTFTTQCGSCTYNGRDNSYKTTKKGKGTAAKSSWEAHHNGASLTEVRDFDLVGGLWAAESWWHLRRG